KPNSVDSDLVKWRFGRLKHTVQPIRFKKFSPSNPMMLSVVSKRMNRLLRATTYLSPGCRSRSRCVLKSCKALVWMSKCCRVTNRHWKSANWKRKRHKLHANETEKLKKAKACSKEDCLKGAAV